MKRSVFFLTVLAILILCVSVIAEETKEITFQDIPWFSSPEEVNKLLKDSGFTDGKVMITDKIEDKEFSHSNIAKYNADTKTPYKYSNNTKDERITYKLISHWHPRTQKTIAKQKVDFLYAYYTADPENPQLVEISMYLKNPNGDYELKPVYDALETAFGKPVTNRNGKEYIWLGANNTIVILNNRSVVFASLDGLEYAETIDVDIEEPEDTGF